MLKKNSTFEVLFEKFAGAQVKTVKDNLVRQQGGLIC